MCPGGGSGREFQGLWGVGVRGLKVVMLIRCGIWIPDREEWVHRSEQDRWIRALCPPVRKEFCGNKIDFDPP